MMKPVETKIEYHSFDFRDYSYEQCLYWIKIIYIEGASPWFSTNQLIIIRCNQVLSLEQDPVYRAVKPSGGGA